MTHVDNYMNDDNKWFKLIGSDAQMPTVGTKSKYTYKALTSRFHRDENGNAVMDKPVHKKVQEKRHNGNAGAVATARSAMLDWQARSDAGLIPECPYF